MNNGRGDIQSLWIDWPFYLSILWLDMHPKEPEFKTLQSLLSDMEKDKTYETPGIFSRFLRENGLISVDTGDQRESLTGVELFHILKDSAKEIDKRQPEKLGTYPFYLQ